MSDELNVDGTGEVSAEPNGSPVAVAELGSEPKKKPSRKKSADRPPARENVPNLGPKAVQPVEVEEEAIKAPKAENVKKGKRSGSTSIVVASTNGAPLEDGPLTQEEVVEFEDLSLQIRSGLDQFRIVGQALSRIREKRLYREKYRTFAEYCETEWDFSSRNANYLITAENNAKQLESEGAEDLAMLSQTGARELESVPQKDRAKVYEKACQIAKEQGKKKVQREHVQEAAESLGKKRGRPAGSENKPKDVAEGNSSVPSEIREAQDNGHIPQNSVIEATYTQEGESQPVKKDSDLSDDDWLDKFPIRDSLIVKTRKVFDAEAIAYRALEKARLAFTSDVLDPVVSVVRKRLGELGPYTRKVAWVMRIAHPSAWMLCASCKGNGATKSGECVDCNGDGFHVAGTRKTS